MAAKHPITIDQGADWSLPMRLVVDGSPVPLSDWTAAFQVRQTPSSEVALVSASTQDGRITLDAQGYVTVALSETVTRAITPAAGSLIAQQRSGVTVQLGYYALDLRSPDGDDLRLVEGEAFLSLEIAR